MYPKWDFIAMNHIGGLTVINNSQIRNVVWPRIVDIFIISQCKIITDSVVHSSWISIRLIHLNSDITCREIFKNLMILNITKVLITKMLDFLPL